jgi:hypothetical protein
MWCADRLSIPDRERVILVGLIVTRLGHELVTRDCTEGIERVGIRDPTTGSQLIDELLASSERITVVLFWLVARHRYHADQADVVWSRT